MAEKHFLCFTFSYRQESSITFFSANKWTCIYKMLHYSFITFCFAAFPVFSVGSTPTFVNAHQQSGDVGILWDKELLKQKQTLAEHLILSVCRRSGEMTVPLLWTWLTFSPQHAHSHRGCCFVKYSSDVTDSKQWDCQHRAGGKQPVANGFLWCEAKSRHMF